MKKILVCTSIIASVFLFTGCALGVEVPTLESEAEKAKANEEVVLGATEEVAEDSSIDIARVIAGKASSVDSAFGSINLLDYEVIESDKEVNDKYIFPIYSTDMSYADLVALKFCNDGLSYEGENAIGATLTYRFDGMFSTDMLLRGISPSEAVIEFSLVDLTYAKAVLDKCSSRYIVGSNLGGLSEDGHLLYLYVPYKEGELLELCTKLPSDVEGMDSVVLGVLKNIEVENKGSLYTKEEHDAGVFKYVVGNDYIVSVKAGSDDVGGKSSSDDFSDVLIPDEDVQTADDGSQFLLSIDKSAGIISYSESKEQSDCGFQLLLNRVENEIPSKESLIDGGTTSWGGCSLGEGLPNVLYAFTQVKTNSKAKSKDLTAELNDFKGNVSVECIGVLGNSSKYINLQTQEAEVSE